MQVKMNRNPELVSLARRIFQAYSGKQTRVEKMYVCDYVSSLKHQFCNYAPR